uniref:DNA/RNA-binding protein KIN17-like n=2 Tax=Hirondellea gigas TaxID=1518452 RepID=A0A6A7G728_9CRUS
MGKAEKGTPKYLANKMKAKGLQKLRWYCQMCEKQCRDENGFKCHTMSESHQRQLLLFADNPDKYLDTFSEEFFTDYLSLLKRRFGTKRVQANNVYQEYIQDRNHIHMNATQWETLTDFVKWLGRESHCIVDETEKGWYVTYIDKDPETLLRQEKLAKKEKHELDAEERRQAFIDRQVELGRERAKDLPEAVFTDLKRDGEDPIKVNLLLHTAPKTVATTSVLASLSKSKSTFEGSFKKPKDVPKKRSALGEIMEEEKRQKLAKLIESKENEALAVKNDAPWVVKDAIVKIITKTLGSAYYKEKAVVLSVVDDYVAKVKLLNGNTKLKLDQTHLETVIPSVGRLVVLLAGEHKGDTAELRSLQVDSYSATLKLRDSNKLLLGIPYEQFTKLYNQEGVVTN